MHRPLVPVALSFAVGIGVGDWLPAPLAWLFALSALVLLLFFLRWLGRPHWLLVALFLLGWADQSLHQAILSPFDLRLQVGDEPALAALRGRLLVSPETRLLQDPAAGRLPETRCQAPLEVQACRLHGEWRPAVGTVLVTMPGLPGSELYGGRQVEVSGVLKRPPVAVAPGLFDYRNYLEREGIRFLLQAGLMADWNLLDAGHPPPRPWSDRFGAWAARVLAYDLPEHALSWPGLSGDEPFELLCAMTLGWKAPLTDAVSLPFMRTGTMHIFAISGLHIALIVGILVNLLRALRLPREACGAVVIPAIWAYTAATGWQPSAVRSTIMMTIVLAGWSLHRPMDLLNSLAGAAWLLLMWKPAQLFQAGFQLSFGVVLSIALLLPLFEEQRQRFLAPDPLIPDSLRPRWQVWSQPLWDGLSRSLLTSLAAFLGSVALIAQYFHLFTPISLLANLAVVPLSSLALMANLGALCCGTWLPWLTALFNHSSWFWMKMMIGICSWVADWPGAWMNIRSFSWLEWGLLYAGLGLLVQARTWGPRLRRWSWSLWAAVLLFWLAMLAWPADVTRLTVLPAGSAAAVFCDAPGRAQDLLFDAGTERQASFVVRPFLQSLGVNRLARLVLTDADLHHVGGCALLGSFFRFDLISTPSADHRSAPYRQLLARLREQKQPWEEATRGEECGAWRVLHPAPSDHFRQADDGIVVLAAAWHGFRILVLGELGAQGQAALLAREPDLRADVVLVGLPSQGVPLRPELLHAIEPRVVVLTSSAFSSTRPVRPELLSRLQRRGAALLNTGEEGAVTLEFTAAGLHVQSMTGRSLTLSRVSPPLAQPYGSTDTR